MKYWGFVFLFTVCSTFLASGQSDTLSKRVEFVGDMRFRVEHDWNSRTASGSFRDDRTRFRLRGRVGLNFRINAYTTFGTRIRTGNINDQQGPHITLGSGTGEFGLFQIGFEKAFVNFNFKRTKINLGKFSFPFYKQDELFWNDNVFPDGLSGSYALPIEKVFEKLELTAGHFVIRSNNGLLSNDSYFQGIQLNAPFRVPKSGSYLSYYRFRNISYVPDNFDDVLNYSILNFGAYYQIIPSRKIVLGFDVYQNFTDYQGFNFITEKFKDQKLGLVASIKYGELKKKKDFLIHLYLANLERFSIVDYFAQNDWARWDYSSQNGSGSRLSNMKGFELRLGYAIDHNLNLVLRMYMAEQILTASNFKETGSRIRLDLDAKF